jgi:photosystem II stability/assembly factor-like uncharacterized protein
MWTFLGPRNVSGRITALAVHPADSHRVYAAGETGGLFRSLDGGHAWQPLMHQEASLVIGGLAAVFDPADPAATTFYAGTGRHVNAGQQSFLGAGLLVSTDDGWSWTLQPSLAERAVTVVVVDPADDAHVAVGGRSGLVHSPDRGLHWAMLLPGTVSDAAWDPNDPSKLYVCLHNDGLKRIDFAGGAFAVADLATPVAPFAWVKLAVGRGGVHGSSFLLLRGIDGQIYRSTDAGMSWDTGLGVHAPTLSGADPGVHAAIAVSPDDENVIVAGGTSIEWTENGATWHTTSVPHSDHHAFAFAPSDPLVFYDGNDGGVTRFDRSTGTWTQASNGLATTQFYFVDVWPPLTTVVSGGCQDVGLSVTPGGLTWHQDGVTDSGQYLVRADDPRWHYGNSYADILASPYAGVALSNHSAGLDARRPWLTYVTADPVSPQKLFAGTDTVFVTTDGLATPWVAASQAFPGYVSAIAAARSDPSRVYAGTGAYYPFADPGAYCELYRSTTGGAPGSANG